MESPVSVADTPLMAQWRKLKAEAGENTWLFFRLGDFFELFERDAQSAAPILDVQLTSRDGRTPMCGVPHHALDLYLQRALQAGVSVAVAEQLTDPKDTAGRGLVERSIVRRITPGTFVPEDGELTGPLVGLVTYATGFGLAALWLAEGRAVAFEYRGTQSSDILRREWDRLQPAECIMREGDPPAPVPTVRLPELFLGRGARKALTDHLGLPGLRSVGLEDQPWAQEALVALIRYGQNTQQKPLRHLTRISSGAPGGGLYVDRRVARQLGVFNDDGPSLFQFLNRTLTPMGQRRLRQWLTWPLADRDAIQARQAAVQGWLQASGMRSRLRHYLASVGDLERRLARLTLGLGQPRDLARVAQAVMVGLDVYRLLSSIDPVCRSGVEPIDLQPLADLLDPINPEAPTAWDQGGILRPGFRPAVDSLRALAQNHREALVGLEQQLREETGIRNLKVGTHRTLGFYVEVTRSQIDRVPPDWHRKQSMVGAERYTLDRLESLSEAILTAETEWLALEEQEARHILQEILARCSTLAAWADAAAWLDVVQSLADVAETAQLTCPGIDGTRFDARGIRHPLVEQSVDHYVPSSLALGADARIALITGPNMAGKSTFMRAVALNAWLAHAGSFVAADTWSQPLLDGIFTRIGADDDLMRGQSTFMVEMEEMAQILHGATGRSLVVLDELGRGTSTFDGMAIAWAVLEHLLAAMHGGNGPWTLFATHYHELTGLERNGVINLTVEAMEQNGKLLLLHEVKPGTASQSFGIAVAAMAGLPRSVVHRAERLLKQWEREGKPAPLVAAQQRNWLDQDPVQEEIMTELNRLDLNRLTPLQALEILADWQRRQSP